MERAHVAAVVVSLALIGATLEPLARDPYDDSFPLSTYPMFATKRPAIQTFRYALGETRDGKRRTLSPSMIGSGEILQALKIVEHAVGKGRGELAALCQQIAARVAADGDFNDVVAIRIVSGTHDAVEYLARDHVGPETELSRCPVVR
ncbi:MAG TPA: hypothetical protein VLB44_06905 [Kofleriaceae bacterium]|nr:hypothetical protein [Kofleriaceae bacterium]